MVAAWSEGGAAVRRRLPDALAAWRNRVVSAPRFQAWAAAFPLTRRLVRRDGERLFDLMAGFTYSQVLMASVELGLLNALADGPLAADELAARSGMAPERIAVLCQAAAALGLLDRTGAGAYRLGRLGAEIVAVPGLTALIRHHRMLYADLADPVGLLRGTAEPSLASFWPYVLGGAVSPAEAEAYSELMAATQALVAEEVLRSISFKSARHLMDVGGGTGAFLIAAARRQPRLRLTLVDLPAVVAAARPRIAAAGLEARIDLSPTDFRTDALPEGADTISLVRVLYDHPDAVVAALLARVVAALPPGGRIVVAEPMAGGAHPDRFADAYFALYTLAMRTGRVRSPAEIARLLGEAGFRGAAPVPTLRPFITQIVTATKPL